MRKKYTIAGGITATIGLTSIAALWAASAAIESRIVSMVQDELEQDMAADITLGDADVSLFADFPSVRLRLRDLAVIGQDGFAGIPLAEVEEIRVVLDLGSVLFGDAYQISRLTLISPSVHLIIDEDGAANYDLWPEATESDAPSAFHLRLDDLKLDDLGLVYEDRSSGLFTELAGIDHRSTGDITQDLASLITHTEVGSVSARYGDWSVLEGATLLADGGISYDLNSGGITLSDLVLTLNALSVGLEGTAIPSEAGWQVDLAYEARDTEFKSLLSVLPNAYTADFAEVDATGTLSLAGTAKGLYASEGDHLPAFDLAVAVRDARVKYPGLPSSVEGIAASIAVSHPEGATDLTAIDISPFALTLSGAPLTGSLAVRSPTTDPDIALKARGRLELAALQRAWPMPGTQTSGIVDMDIDVAGRQSAFTARAVDQVHAEGRLSLTDVRYASEDLPVDALIEQLEVTLTPQRAEVAKLQTRFGNSDVSGTGQLDNIVPYFLGGQTLSGHFDLTGQRLDLEPFAGGDESTDTPSEDAGMLVAVPTDLDLELGIRFGRIDAMGLTFENAKGKLVVRDGAMRMDGMKLELLGGQVELTGAYIAPTVALADIDLSLDAVRFDVKRTMTTFTSLRKILPAAQGASGMFDSGMKLKGRLGADGTPDLSVLFSKGTLRTYDVALTPAALAMVAEQLFDPKFKKLELDTTSVFYELLEGRLAVDPTDVKLGDVPAVMHGTAGVLDQTMDLSIDLALPTRSLRGAPWLAGASEVLGDEVDVRVKLVGPWAKPTVTAGLREGLAGKVKDKVDAVVGEVTADLLAAARAEGDKLVAAAEEQAERLRAEAKKAADVLRREAKAAGTSLVTDAGSNPLAVAAAKEGAKKLEDEADKKARRLEREADTKGKSLVEAATLERDRLVGEAGGTKTIPGRKRP